MATYGGANIVTSGSVMYLDAANAKSYVSGSLIWNDLSRNSNNLGISGSPAFTSTTPPYFTFAANQITQYCIKNPISFPTTQATAELWIRVPNNTANMALISYAAPGAGLDNDFLLFFSSGILFFYGPGATTPTGVTTTWQPATNTWYHVVRTSIRSSGVDRLYINGTLFTTLSIGAGTNFTTNGALVLGQEQDSVGGTFDPLQCFQGNIAYVQVYNRALSASEVLQNYNALKSRFNL